MRHATVRPAVLAVFLTLAAACTGEHMTIGPPHSTAPSAGAGATGSEEADVADTAETAPADATGTATATGTGTAASGTGAAGKGATDKGAGATPTAGRLPASIGPGADIALRLADVGTRRGACLRSSC